MPRKPANLERCSAHKLPVLNCSTVSIIKILTSNRPNFFLMSDNSTQSKKKMSSDKGKRKKRSQWSQDEVALLLDLWEEKMPQFRAVKRNSHIYEDMAVEMAFRGFLFSNEEIKVKIHNLTNKYRTEKNAVGSTGGSPSAWEHFNKVHQILGGYKSFRLKEMVEESTDQTYEAEYLDESYDSSSVQAEVVDQLNESSTLSEECSEQPMKKRRKDQENINFQSEFLNEFRAANQSIALEMKELKEESREALKIEKERNVILEKFIQIFKESQK